MNRHVFLLVGFVLSSGGCSLAPDYVQPESPIPRSWSESAENLNVDTVADPMLAPDIQWKDFFPDPRMQEVIELALANNRDLRVAALNIEKAQALYGIQRSQLMPSVGVAAAGDTTRVPEGMSLTGHVYTQETYTVGLGVAAWELDLFGRVRSLKEAALQQFFATQYARSAAQISLVAAVANSYLAMAADRESLQLAQTTLETQKDSYELIRQSREFGVASELDLRQAQAQVEVARVDVAAFTGRVAVDENALSLLIGVPLPDELLPDTLESVRAPKDVSAGVSSEVLLQRPDILMAESRLQAMNANIGAARAAFFPRISLTGSVGTISTDLSGLFGAGAGTWSFMPQITLPIFTGGANRANLDAAYVDREIGISQYEKAIQVAFREVKDSLALRTTLDDQAAAQEALVDAVEVSFRLYDARYKAGIDAYLGVLVAQRSLYGAQQGLVNVRLALLANRVALYKVLGGGDLMQAMKNEGGAPLPGEAKKTREEGRG